MKISKCIKLCNRARRAKDIADHKKDIVDLRTRGYTDNQYESMVASKHYMDAYQKSQDDFILQMVRERADPYINGAPVITVDKNYPMPNMDKYYERLNNLYEEPTYIKYEEIKSLRK